MTPKLETDSSGNVIMKPLTGWNILPVAGAAVLVQMQYAETPEELERGVGLPDLLYQFEC